MFGEWSNKVMRLATTSLLLATAALPAAAEQKKGQSGPPAVLPPDRGSHFLLSGSETPGTPEQGEGGIAGVPTSGACCLDGGCSETAPAICDNIGGVFFGPGTRCSTGMLVRFALPDAAIPDAVLAVDGMVSDTITVTESFSISDIDIDLRVTHTWVGDLIVQVEHLGTTVTLISRMGFEEDPADCCGCASDNLDIVLDDEATGGPIESQCMDNLMSPPSFTPNNPLSAFDGMGSAGDWTITVFDGAGGDTGTLDRWTIRFTSVETSPCPGACCLEGEPCRVTSSSDCATAGGMFAAGATCEPSIDCPSDVTIECDGSADPSATGFPLAGGCPVIDYSDEVEISQLCAQTGTITRTWTATYADDKGEFTETCVQTITVADMTPPVIECSADVVTTCLSPSGTPEELVDIGATASDNCSKPSDCCEGHGSAGCETAICEAAVCSCDSYCCDTQWDEICATDGIGGVPGCGAQLLCGTLCQDICDTSNCCENRYPTTGCSDAACEALVCEYDSFCCEFGWDNICTLEAEDLCTTVALAVTDNIPEYFAPTCGDDPNIVTFTVTDACGNTNSCDVEVAVIGAMCCEATTDTDLKLMITDLDLRQDNEGPGNTKARFDIWNSNEVRFSGTERCIICWDETLISDYGPIANHLIIENLQTDKGKARIQNEASTVCPESTDAALLGVAIQETQFAGSPYVEMRSAVTLVGMGEQAARIQYDIINEPEEANDGGFAIGQVPGVGTTPDAPSMINDDVTVAGGVADNRASTTFKGSLVSWPVIEVKWDAYGTLIQDTFITIMNDNPGQVKIQFYQVNGDAPLDPVFCCDPQQLVERAHPGWNWSDYQVTLTGDESAYWSVASGLPKGVSPISVLDAGNPNGRPDLDPSNPGGRVLRGFLVGWAVNDNGQEIRWNHLKGHAVVIRYDQATAFDYNPWNFRVVSGVAEGAQSDGDPGSLLLNGEEYDYAPETLLFDFFAAGTSALSHPDAVNFDNDD